MEASRLGWGVSGWGKGGWAAYKSRSGEKEAIVEDFAVVFERVSDALMR